MYSQKGKIDLGPKDKIFRPKMGIKRNFWGATTFRISI